MHLLKKWLSCFILSFLSDHGTAVCVLFYERTNHSLTASPKMNTYFSPSMYAPWKERERESSHCRGSDVTNVTLANQLALMQLFSRWILFRACVADWQSKHTAASTDRDQIQSLWKSWDFFFLLLLPSITEMRHDLCFIPLNRAQAPEKCAWNTQRFYRFFHSFKGTALQLFDEGYNTSLLALRVSIHSY